MQTSTDLHAVYGRRDLPRISCTTCQHSEFVHCDFDDRLCLYSECVCSGFSVEVAA